MTPTARTPVNFLVTVIEAVRRRPPGSPVVRGGRVTDHVQETDHAEGTTHKGFSSCNPSENNPSERSSGGKSQA